MREIRIACEAPLVPLSDLKVIQGDLKTLTKERFEDLSKAIEKDGFAFAIHYWVNKEGQKCILDGTQRYRVASKQAQDGIWKLDAVPAVQVHAASFKDAVLTLLHGASSYGTPDSQGLYELTQAAGLDVSELEEVALAGVDIDKHRAEYYESAEIEGQDGVPEVPTEAKTKLGELWLLGEHRLLIGDCTVKENVERLMGGEKADLWCSDPPYGINHVDTSQEKNQSVGYQPIANDDLQDEALQKFIHSAISVSLPHMNKGFAFYMWHAMKMQSYFAAAAAAAAAAGILFHRQIIWKKAQFVFGRGQYHWRHELCLMGWLEGNECPFYGERNQSTVWEIGRENDKIHPTQKPTAIYEIPIQNHTKMSAIVYEPFAGSGTAIIACEKTMRRCFATELEPLYGDVILSRWAKFTGKDPVREDGKKWSEVSESQSV